MAEFPRTSKRNRMVEMARLVTDEGAVYSCIIRDLSAGGAMLRVPAGVEIEGRVRVVANILRRERSALVKWRDETSIGIAFED
ncbi:PilZ domain-containing protein [Bosea sp. AK1]|uniref:PilZ domain-containing protein n=2 Tax=Boseaceae TaxID=2831100 RepID=UPI00237A76F4|nr:MULTISPECIES: PilZ domain-containing protein [Bosea]